MAVSPTIRWALSGLTAGLVAAQELIPMSAAAHGIVSVALVVFAALGIIPPHVEPEK